MKVSTILLGIVFLFLVACSDNKTKQHQKGKMKVIDLEKVIDKADEPLKLSDFVEDIEYIRPEYPASLVDMIFDVSIDDNYLLLFVGDRILCYSRDGKFLREIGKKGQGPKEHLGIRDFSLHDSLVAIHSNWIRKILWYNTDGEYITQTPVGDNINNIDILDNDKIAIHYHPHTTSIEDPNLSLVGIINSKGDTLELKKSKPYYSKGATSNQSIWKYGDTTRLLTCFNDTIYSVSKEGIKPTYIVNFGKYKVSHEVFADLNMQIKERHNFIGTPTFGETSKHIFVFFNYKKKRWFGVYDKQTTKISSWSVEPDGVNQYDLLEGGGWENDVDGGFAPRFLRTDTNGYIIANVPADELKTQFLENKERIKVKYPEKQQKLEQLVNSLSDDENPVIVVYKLKNRKQNIL